MYKIMEVNEIDIKIDVNKPDKETKNDKWFASLNMAMTNNISIMQIYARYSNLSRN